MSIAGGVVAAMVGLTLLAPAAGSAQLRFWGYWQNKGTTWAFATTGPAQAKPADGSVQGWRYAAATGEEGTPPRSTPDFDAICGSRQPQEDRKRVAVVIDFGEATDAPSGQAPPRTRTGCAVVATAATGLDVMAAVGKPQADPKGLICAIDAYPTADCGGSSAGGDAAAGSAAPSSTAPRAGGSGGSGNSGNAGDSGGSPVELIGGLIAVLVIAGAGVGIAIRRRRTGGSPQA
jgi:hypothetical protein